MSKLRVDSRLCQTVDFEETPANKDVVEGLQRRAECQ